jgi:uncharacterized protein (DUF58 family)
MERRTQNTEHSVPDDRQPSAQVAGAPSALLSRLQWTVLRPIATYLGGDERSIVRGFGPEFTEVREYQPGDDVRHIDWNITARTDRPFVREAHVERALDVWLVLDMSASVTWGTADCLKRDRMIEFAAVISHVLGRHGNRVGALVFADRPLSFVAPSAGRSHILRMMAALQAEPAQAATGDTDLRSALIQASAVIRRHSLVLVVSDFLAPEGWQTAIGSLAQRHEVVGVRLRDPREGELPDVGFVTLENPETGEQIFVDTSDRQLRERFQRAGLAQDQAIGAALAHYAVDQLLLRTDESLLPAVISFVEQRRRRRVQGARSATGALRGTAQAQRGRG